MAAEEEVDEDGEVEQEEAKASMTERVEEQKAEEKDEKTMVSMMEDVETVATSEKMEVSAAVVGAGIPAAWLEKMGGPAAGQNEGESTSEETEAIAVTEDRQ